MTYRAWICEGCGRGQRIRDNVWDCPGCGKEGCDDCFWIFATCKDCCRGKTEREVWAMAAEKGYDFSEPENPDRIAFEDYRAIAKADSR